MSNIATTFEHNILRLIYLLVATLSLVQEFAAITEVWRLTGHARLDTEVLEQACVAAAFVTLEQIRFYFCLGLAPLKNLLANSLLVQLLVVLLAVGLRQDGTNTSIIHARIYRLDHH